MRRGVAIALVGLGAFLLILAPLLRFYVVPSIAKAPLKPSDPDDPDRTISLNVGTATALFDPATLTERRDVPLTATRVTRGDVLASEQDPAEAEGLAVWDSFQRVEDETGTVVTASTIRIAFDRVSSELKNCCGVNNDGKQVEWAGTNPLKFPFFTEQKSYDYFDTTINQAVPIEFVGEEEVEGLSAYKFTQTIEPTQIGEQELPGNLVGSPDASFVAPRFYSNVRTLWVEPTTGAIVNGQEQQKQTFRGPDGTDKVTVIEANLGFAPQEITDSVEYAGSNARLINLLRTTIPIIALILGLILIGAAVYLLRREETVERRHEVVVS